MVVKSGVGALLVLHPWPGKSSGSSCMLKIGGDVNVTLIGDVQQDGVECGRCLPAVNEPKKRYLRGLLH